MNWWPIRLGGPSLREQRLIAKPFIRVRGTILNAYELREDRTLKAGSPSSPAMCDSAACSGVNRFAMYGVRRVFRAANDVLRLGDRLRSAMDNQQELVGFQRHVVLEDAILRDADAYQACSHCAHSPNNSGAFKTGDDPCHQRASYENRSEARY